MQGTELETKLAAAANDLKEKEEQIKQLLAVSKKFEELEKKHEELTSASDNSVSMTLYIMVQLHRERQG